MILDNPAPCIQSPQARTESGAGSAGGFPNLAPLILSSRFSRAKTRLPSSREKNFYSPQMWRITVLRKRKRLRPKGLTHERNQ
jgi:hypothetical protein